jgi:SPOR domain
VPIAIAGQPAPAPVAAPTPITPSAVVPQATAPVAAPPTPTAAPVVAAARPADAETPAAPRRVRTVPIKTDADSAPKAQARPAQPAPRIVPAAEPETANAPMRITPQALRGSQRVASAAPAEVAEPAARPATTSGGGSGFSVQLGAEGSQDSARAKFNKIKGDHSDVLGDQNANIRNAEVNGKSIYRIRVGNMSREQAVSMCERLKADGGNCFVAKN